MRSTTRPARRPAVGVYWPPSVRLMLSRGRPYYCHRNDSPIIGIATLPRRRTRHALPRWELRTLAERRALARRARAIGLRRIGPRTWYDPAADVHYAAASWAPASGWED